MNSPAPALAVVVVGRNEEENLDRCFASIRAIDYPAEEWELVYVDSGSTDRSREIAQRWGARVIALSEPPHTAGRGRDAGWRATSARLIQFVDGDCALKPDFIAQAILKFDDPKVAIVWGRVDEVPSFWLQRLHALRFHGHPEGPGRLMGGNYLSRRAALEAVGGYNRTLKSGENGNLSARLRDGGFLVIHIHAPMVLHNSRITGWGPYLRRAIRFGYGEARLTARDPAKRPRSWDRGTVERLRDLLGFAAFLLFSVVSLVLWGFEGLSVSAGLFVVLVLTAAWRARRKGNLATVLLYGLHAQLYCLPLIVGHVRYRIEAATASGRPPDPG